MGFRIKIIIEPNEKLVSKVDEILSSPIPQNRQEKYQYYKCLDEKIDEILSYKSVYYKKALSEYFNKGANAYPIPIEQIENNNIENAIWRLFNKQSEIFAANVRGFSDEV